MEIALGRDIVAFAEVAPVVLSQYALDLVRSKQIVRALTAAAVSVLPAVITALRRFQLAQAVIERALGGFTPERHMPVLPGLGVAKSQQGVVVQRLFKMRREPLAVGRIAGKAAADMVVYTAPVHLTQGVFDHLPGLFPSAELGVLHKENEVMRRGELGRAAEAAVLPVV